jgi:hypothetical protein
MSLVPGAALALEGSERPWNFNVAGSGGPVLVEWASVSVGGGAIFGTPTYADIVVGLFTVSQEHWYLTPIEGGILLLENGRRWFGGRLGYQHFIGAGWAVRAGVKLGWTMWNENTDCYIYDGIDISPHVQFIKFFRHGSVGLDIEAPIQVKTSIVGGTNCMDCGDPEDVYAGIMGYVRLSAF